MGRNKIQYEIVFGNRRFHACKKLGWKTIPAIVEGEVMEVPTDRVLSRMNTRTDASTDVLELMQSIKHQGLLQPIKVQAVVGDEQLGVSSMMENITENAQRSDVSPVELGGTVEALVAEGLSVGEVAVRTGISATKLSKCREMFNRCPEEFKSAIGFNRRDKAAPINFSSANVVLGSRGDNLSLARQTELLHVVAKHRLTTTETKNLVSLVRNTDMSVEQAFKSMNDVKTAAMWVTYDVKKLRRYMRSIGAKENVSSFLVRMLVDGLVAPKGTFSSVRAGKRGRRRKQ